MKWKNLLLFFLFLSLQMQAAQITLTTARVWGHERYSNHTPNYAIDDSLSTYTWSTESSPGSGWYKLAVDFGVATSVNRIRLYKDTNYGYHDLKIMYTADSPSIALPSRSFQNVSGLTNGFGGQELMNAAAVNSDGTVNTDQHYSTNGDGWASLTFDTVTATGLAIEFNSQGTYSHYKVYEFQAYSSETVIPEPCSIFLVILSGFALLASKVISPKTSE